MALNEQSFYVLAALAQGPRHGYAIITETDQISEGRYEMKISTLYGVLDRLSHDGLIEVDREEIHQGRMRRYYRLTRAGNGVLQEETKRYAALARAGQRRLATALSPAPHTS